MNKHKSRIITRFYLIYLLILVISVGSIILITKTWIEVSTLSSKLENHYAMETYLPVKSAPQYGFTDKDIYLLAQVLCGDKNKSGDGEYDIDFKLEIDYYEIGKVLCVIMNRVRSPLFPNTIYDVVLQSKQFSVMPQNLVADPSIIALATVKIWCEAYDEYSPLVQIIPSNHLYFVGDGFTNTTRGQ